MYQNDTIMTTTQQYADKMLTKLGCMACGFTSIEKSTIFDLWQVSYAARSSLPKKFKKNSFLWHYLLLGRPLAEILKNTTSTH